MKLRPSRRLAVGAFALVLASVIGVNVYLNTQYLPRLVAGFRQGLRVDYELAWTLWPGRVHFENVRVRGDEPGFSWQLEADRASLNANLSSLAGDTMTASRLSLSGVRARIRPKLHALEATPELLAHFPPLHEPPPDDLLPEGPVLPPSRRAAEEPMRVAVEDVRVVELRELWIGAYRLEGESDLRGSVFVEPGRVIRFGPSTAKLRDGVAFAEGRKIVERLEGTARGSLGPIDLHEALDFEQLATLTGEASLSAQVVDIGVLRALPGLASPLELQGGVGPLKTKVAVRDGRVLPGAVLDWSSDEVNAHVDGYGISGALRLRATVEEVEGAPRTRARATLANFRLGRDGAPPLAQGDSVDLELDAPNVDARHLHRFGEDLRTAWAKWPARVVMRAPASWGEQRALQWGAHFDQVEASVDLSGLADHRLLLKHARVQGARVRIRPKVTKDEPPGYLALLASIDGLPPPLREGRTVPALHARATANPWSLEVDEAQVEDLSEVWLEAYRFVGHAKASGGFRYEAGGRLSTTPMRLRISDGTLRIARWRAASSITGEIEATLSATDLEEAEGFGFFRGLTSRAEVKAKLEEVDFLRHWPNLPVPAELSGGEGPIRAKVAMRDGVIQAESEVHWSSPRAQAATHGYRVVGPLTLDARWSAPTERETDAKLRVEARVSPYKVTKVGTDRALVGGNVLLLRMDAPPFDLARPAFEPFTSVQVLDGEVPDLRVVNDYVPEDLHLKLEKGNGTFTGRVAWSHRGTATAALKVGGKGAELAWERVRLKGNWTCSAELTNVNLVTGDADIQKATLLFDDMVIHEGARSRDGWFGRVDVSKGKVRPGAAVLLEADVDTTLRDGRPLVAFFISETELLPPWVRNLITLQALRATGHVRVGASLLELDGLNARGQSMEIRGRMRKNGTRQWGDLLVKSRGQEVGVAVRGQRFELKLLGAGDWYRNQLINPQW